jgi:ankyrin repeat protein
MSDDDWIHTHGIIRRPLSALSRTTTHLASRTLARLQAIEVSASLSVLMAAVNAGDLKKVKEIVAGAPALANACIERGGTALHVAAWKADLAILGALIDAGAEPNAANEFGMTALHWAAFADRDVSGGYSPPQDEAEAEWIAWLNEHRKWDDPHYIWPILLGRPLPLPVTIVPRRREDVLPVLDAVNLLLAAGAAVAVNSAVGTPLHCAVEADRIAVAERLINVGADVNVMSRDRNSLTPLSAGIWAERPNAIAAVRLLLSRGADPNLTGGASPLHDATQMQDATARCEIVKLLLESGADPNVRIDWDGQTPLHWLLGNDCPEDTNIEPARLLLAAGADPLLRDAAGLTPIAAAERKGWRGFAQVLHEIGQR